jgi:hypothetical protein
VEMIGYAAFLSTNECFRRQSEILAIVANFPGLAEVSIAPLVTGGGRSAPLLVRDELFPSPPAAH